MNRIMNGKRIVLALIVAAFCGAFCAYGTISAQIPGLVITAALLASIFYERLLIGLVIGLADSVVFVKKHRMLNAVLRGAFFGAVVSFSMAVQNLSTGGTVLIGFGIVYGIVIDTIATKFGS